MNKPVFDIIKKAMYSAKLSSMLAQENIAVEFSSTANTASFNPATRSITFPYNAAMMDEDIHELFILHEVSHALHLPANYSEIIKQESVCSVMVNIVVDIRDERLIKEKYPVAAAIFSRAYKKLLAQEFFGEIELIAARPFSDRLNVYAKCGSAAHFISFSDKEQQFYNDCMKAETFEDCIELAKRLENLKGKVNSKLLREYVMDSIEDLDAERSQEEIDELVSEQEQLINSKTAEELFGEQFKKSLLNNVSIVNFESVERKRVQYSPAADYLDYIKKRRLEYTNYTQTVRDARQSIKQSVNGMVRVFESKKAAERMSNARIQETGLVDVNKIHRYKFDDKIFRSAMNIPNAKNHAYWIMLDFSGSMHRRLRAVIDQMVVLTEFLRCIQVPYRVVIFGANFIHADQNLAYHEVSPSSSFVRFENTPLVEILNNTMTAKDHNMVIASLYDRLGYSLGSTPTASAMLGSEHMANDFFKQTKATKKHIVVITDGSPTDVPYHYGTRGSNTVMVDPTTKKLLTLESSQYSMIVAIANVFKVRYNIETTTISISGSLDNSTVTPFVNLFPTPEQQSEFRKKNYVKIKGGHDFFFAKPVDSDAVSHELGFVVSEDKKMTSSQLSRKLMANLSSIRKSRSFLFALAETLS